MCLRKYTGFSYTQTRDTRSERTTGKGGIESKSNIAFDPAIQYLGINCTPT